LAAGERTDDNRTWFDSGLRFECRRCGTCCRGRPGYVWISDSEIMGVVGYLQMQLDSFGRQYLRQVGDRKSLVEKSNGDCVFWEKSIGCRIYPLRPAQCRAFPFWRQNLSDARTWESTARSCPGIGKGRLFTARDILKRRERTW